VKFHEKLTRLRKEHGWSQTELGERADVHITHLSRLENGKSQPSVEMLQKLARVFGVSMDYLMDEEADELTPVSIKDKTLAERIELLDELSDADRQTVINVIDSMLTKQKMLDLLQPAESVSGR
jgi:transcriptional regulator with XRE-family HTH domain